MQFSIIYVYMVFEYARTTLKGFYVKVDIKNISRKLETVKLDQ